MIDQVWLIYIIITTILISILSVLCGYYIIKYYKKSKNEESCKQRNTILIDIVTLIIWCMRWCNIYVTAINPSGISATIIFYISGMITVPLVTKYSEHVYNLYYEIQLSKSIQKHEWKSIIDNKPTNNWFILNKKKWGSNAFITKISNIYIVFQALIPTCIVIVALCFKQNTVVYNTLYSISYITMTPIMIPIILMLGLYYRVRSFDDVFLIIKQCKHTGYIVIVHCTVTVSLAALYRIMVIESKESSLLEVMNDFGSWFGYPLYILNNTYWVIKNVIDKEVRSDNAVTENIKVKSVLGNEETIDIFMSHLSKGICTFMDPLGYIHKNLIII